MRMCNIIPVDFSPVIPAYKFDKIPACFFQPVQPTAYVWRHHGGENYSRWMVCQFAGPRPCSVAFGLN